MTSECVASRAATLCRSPGVAGFGFHRLSTESVSLRNARGRILAAPVVSAVDVPAIRSCRHGRLRALAASTEGASAYNPLPLRVVGDSMPGCPFQGTVSRGEAVRMMTGAPMPRGTDAVLPAEWVEAETTAALAVVSPGKNVGRRAEDIAARRGAVQAGTSAASAGSWRAQFDRKRNRPRRDRNLACAWWLQATSWCPPGLSLMVFRSPMPTDPCSPR